MGIVLRDAQVRAGGDPDFRGALGAAKDAPLGFKAIRLHLSLDKDAEPAQGASRSK